MINQKIYFTIVSATTGFVEHFTSSKKHLNNLKKRTEVDNVEVFLRDLMQAKVPSLELMQLDEIKLDSQDLPDSLLHLVLEADKLMDVIDEIKFALQNPIQWHTAPYFSCQPECIACCHYTYYLPHELKLKKIPTNIQARLSLQREGMWKLEQKNQRCIFFNQSSNGYKCKIHSIRPVRCRVYPFFPIVHKGRIHVYLESQIKMKNEQERTTLSKDSLLSCPGVNSKQQIKNKMNKTILDYVTGLLHIPKLAKTIVVNPNRVLKKYG